MNRFEQAIHDCMTPTARLLEETTNPLHRAMLLNFWRHVLLEGAGRYDELVSEDMMVEEPVYRVTWGINPGVVTGTEGVLAFYNSVGEAVLFHSDDRLSVADWGICDEITFHQLARGGDLRALGYDVEREDALYHVSSRQAFIWPYDSRARLRGEHLYEDKTSLQIEEVSPDEAITPARAKAIFAEQYAKLEPSAVTASGSWSTPPDDDSPAGLHRCPRGRDHSPRPGHRHAAPPRRVRRGP